MKNKKIQSTKFERYNYVLSGIKQSDPLTTKQIKSIFLVLLEDYLNGFIDETTLEALAGDLYYNLSKSPNYINKTDSELGSALDAASDIVYFSHNDDPSKQERATRIKAELRKYFEHNNGHKKKGQYKQRIQRPQTNFS